jgi:3,4-dihydroxy 2-butanone 4-phosphate synthase
LIPQLKKSSPPSSIQSPAAAAASVSASEPALLVRPVRDRRIGNYYKPRSNSQAFFNSNQYSCFQTFALFNCSSVTCHPTFKMPATIPQNKFDSIPDSIEAFRNGEFLVVLDDPSRENEADLIIAAEDVTTEKMGFLIRHSSGYVCAPLSPELTKSLDLPQMVPNNQDPRGTAYTISVDSADPSVTTGISATDRALACRTLADPKARPDSFRRPGHVLPLRSRPGGVRQRPGHTEAATEFCRLAGKAQAAAICEIIDDGEETPGQALVQNHGMLRGEACITFARKWGLKVCTIADLVAYVEKTEGKLESNGAETDGK